MVSCFHLVYSLWSLASLDGKEWKSSKFLRIIHMYILQTRTESLKLRMVFHDCMRCVLVCKIGFANWNVKIALLRASMVVTYYIKPFRTGADRHNGILMSLLLLVAETKTLHKSICGIAILNLTVVNSYKQMKTRTRMVL